MTDRTAKKKIINLWLLLFISFILTSCYKPNYDEINAGFGYSLTPHSIMIGVKSKETIFDKNNIQLDYYYGFYYSDTVFRLSDENYEFVGFGVYSCNGEDLDLHNDVFDDYHSIENHFFIKEILADEAFNGDYSYTNKFSSGVQYAHSETITVPSEVIKGNKGDFCFRIIAIQYSKPDGDYFYTEQKWIRLIYEILDNDQVKLKFVSYA